MGARANQGVAVIKKETRVKKAHLLGVKKETDNEQCELHKQKVRWCLVKNAKCVKERIGH